MKPEEVIRELNKLKSGAHCSDLDKRDKAVEIAKEAVRRVLIPAKPTPEHLFGNGKCPNCGAAFLDKSTKHCGNCGQALDWRNDV